MADRTGKSSRKTKSDDKVGTSTEAAGKVGSKNDFGIPAKQAQPHDMRPNVGERDSEDHEDDHRAIGGTSTDGQRTKGVGSSGRGKPGAGSGGDVDTDVIGIGSGGSTVSESGPDESEGADVVAPARPERKSSAPLVSAAPGSFVDHGDRVDGVKDVQGSPSGDESASAGEVSSDEATGRNDSE